MKKWLTALVAMMMFMSCACAETLREGDWSEAVKSAQARLVELGYLAGDADGIFGAKTTSAVKLFQHMNGLEITGKIDEATEAVMDGDGVVALPVAMLRGSQGENVVALQERLIHLGFLAGEADGVYGDQTAAAVEAYQLHLNAQGISAEEIGGVAPSGIADGVTQQYLFDVVRSTYITTYVPGTVNTEILRAERRLAALGYMDAEPDEEFDDYAAEALTVFQRVSGLAAHGNLDHASVDALFSERAAAADHYVPHEIQLGDSGMVVAEVQAALIQYGFLGGYPNGMFDADVSGALVRLEEYLLHHDNPAAPLFAAAGSVSIEAQEVLRDGGLFYYGEDVDESACEDEVQRAQRRLVSLFYLMEHQVDKDYGPKTAAAISEFQTKNGLEPTGIADEATQRVLYSAEPVADWTPYMLLVDISDQRVYAHQLNEAGEYEQIAEFICSTGLGDSTPTGVFLDTTPINRWHYFEEFDCYAQYSYRITGNILFHSILYDKPDTSTVRRASIYALGSKASHGCVRLRPEDAQWIFQNCAKGTIVLIAN